MSQQPLDDNYKPIDANLYDASGDQYVSPMAGTVTTDTGGEKYAPYIVNLGDGTTPTQKLAIDASGNASVSVTEINGVAPSMGNGASGTGVQRVTIASDSTGTVALTTGTAVIGIVEIGDGTTPTQKLAIDASGNASVSVTEINGVAPSMGNGVSGTGVQRVTLASDSTGQVALTTGTAVIGIVEIGDGTTPTQKLAIDASGNASVNVAEINGAAPPLGHGLAATAIRVELPTDGTGVIGLNAGSNLVGGVEIYDGAGVNKLAVSAAGDASVDVAMINGAAVPLGHGLAATAIRVELPTDGTGVVGINTGSNVIGIVEIGDGTTPTQKLAIDASGNASVNVAEVNGVAPSMGNGISGTGVQRVTIASDSTGTVAATQSGTWNVTNISGTVSLPTGASTSANQATANASLSSIDGKITAVNTGAVVVSSSALPTGAALEAGGNLATLAGVVSGSKAAIKAASGDFVAGAIADLAHGQATMANSVPVTMASDQGPSNIIVLASGSRTTTQTQADQATPAGVRGLRVVLDMTDVGASPDVTLKIDAKDEASGKYTAMLTGAAVTTVTTNVYVIYPTIIAVANSIAQTALPRTWRVVVTANSANAGTYSVGASYLY